MMRPQSCFHVLCLKQESFEDISLYDRLRYACGFGGIAQVQRGGGASGQHRQWLSV